MCRVLLKHQFQIVGQESSGVMKKYKISELAKVKDVDTQTLRHYDKIGLLKPGFIDESSGYRYYTLDQFHLLDIIKFYKLTGLSLNEIKEIIEIEDIDERIGLIKKQNHLFLDKIREYQQVIEGMNCVIDRVEKARKEYAVMGSRPRLMIHQGFTGYIQSMEAIKSNYDYEIYLKKIRDDMVSEDVIHHNQGPITVSDLSKYLVGESYSKKLILEASSLENPGYAMEHYEVGPCIRAIHKGDKETGSQVIQEMMNYGKREGLVLKNEIIFKVIVDSYFVVSDDDYMVEMIIPIEETTI